MQAPTSADLLNEPVVQQALEQAWNDSLPGDPLRRHEEGGWIYKDNTTGNLVVRRASAGAQASLDLSAPPMVPGAVVVATFHTHPNPSAEGWEPGPSSADVQLAWLLGVPFLIRADDGIHATGPASRRGGLTGGPGYPP
ncbi:MAG TPA: Mov34/MPN/PAD-1 family protein [Pirellulales bacterium]|nr:Mov34/MPN/PAD-1 family protein [Pirellulales bacterium]